MACLPSFLLDFDSSPWQLAHKITSVDPPFGRDREVRNWHIADDVLVGPKVRYVKLSGAPLRRGSGFGAFHPLTRVPSKVASANTLGTLRLGRGNWSSCPTAAVEEQLSGRVIALKHSVGRLR